MKILIEALCVIYVPDPTYPPGDSDREWDQCYQSCSKCINFPLWDQLCKLGENDIGAGLEAEIIFPYPFFLQPRIDLVDKLVWNVFTTFLLNPHYRGILRLLWLSIFISLWPCVGPTRRSVLMKHTATWEKPIVFFMDRNWRNLNYFVCIFALIP